MKPLCPSLCALAALAACGPDGDAPGYDTGPIDCAPQGALVGVATDYAVGNVFTLDPDALLLTDRVAPVSGDPLIVSVYCRIAQLNRGGTDSIRLYAPGRFERPRWERALPPGANPHAVVRHNDALVVALYGAEALLVLDVDTGETLTSVDLSAFADADGIPEADSLAVIDGQVWVALQRFRRDLGWQPEAGRLVRIDPSGWAVGEVVETGPSPVLVQAEGDEGRAWVRTGAWFAGDGALAPLTAAGLGAPVLDEAEEGADIADVAVGADGALLAVLAPLEGAPWRLRCHGAGGWLGGWTTDAFVADAAIGPGGEAWLALRASWTPGAADPTGLLPFDLTACAPTRDTPLQTQLEPYSIGFF